MSLVFILPAHASFFKTKIRSFVAAIKHIPPFYPPQQEIDQFHATIMKGDMQKMQSMLASEKKLLNACTSGRTPLLTASTAGRTHIAHFFVEKGADVTAPDSVGMTALHHFASTGDHQWCEKLLVHGADVNARDTHDRTPVLFAAKNGAQGNPLMTACVLVKAGADVNLADKDGNAPVGSVSLASPADARSDASNRVMKTLVDAGANLKHANKKGEQPIHIYARMLSPKNVQTIIEQGQKTGKIEEYVKAVDLQGGNALHHVAQSNQYFYHPSDAQEVIESLTKAGIGCNESDNQGQTPLHHAKALRNATVSQVLLGANACPNCPDNEGKTPIDLENQWMKAQREFDTQED